MDADWQCIDTAQRTDRNCCIMHTSEAHHRRHNTSTTNSSRSSTCRLSNDEQKRNRRTTEKLWRPQNAKGKMNQRQTIVSKNKLTQAECQLWRPHQIRRTISDTTSCQNYESPASNALNWPRKLNSSSVSETVDSVSEVPHDVNKSTCRFNRSCAVAIEHTRSCE